MLKPQDILVLLKLAVLGEQPVSTVRLATDLDMSASEVHQGLGRADRAGLLLRGREPGARTTSKRVHRANLLEFLVHGIKYVFPPTCGGETRGMPTLHAAPPLNGHFRDQGLPPVWPDPSGTMRGLEFSPLFRSVPAAASRDPLLYEMLVLVDALRGGRARERAFAADELTRRLG